MTTGKYNNNRITVDQIRFDSQEESRFYELLKRMKANGEILNFELQPKYLLQPAFKCGSKTVRAIYYIGDFLIYHNDGTEEVIDIKGMAVPVALMKRKMMQYRYPELKLTWLSRSLKYGDENGWIEYDELKKRRKSCK
jgi:hypothetical protein